MKKISTILLICMVFSLFCSCERQLAESSVPFNEETSDLMQYPDSDVSSDIEDATTEQSSWYEDFQSSDFEEISSTVSFDVSYTDSSSRKPVRPSENSKPTTSQMQTSTSAASSSISSIHPVSSQASSEQISVNKGIVPIKEEEYYGYLELQKNGTAAEKKAYQILKREIGNYQREVKFDFKISREEAERAYYYYRDDYPQHFWHGNTLLFKGIDQNIDTLVLRDMLCGGDAQKVKVLDMQMRSAAQKILKNINGSMTEFEREEYIHNYLVNNCVYDEAEYSHTAYGAIVTGKAVCEGYAYAFEYLMRLAGVQCISVKGVLYQQGKEPENHEWNMVELDGEYYHIDLTSDDPFTVMQDGTTKNVLKFTYFNLDETTIQKDHKVQGNPFEIPRARSKKYNYFEYYKLAFDKISVENFAKAYAHAAERGYGRASMKIKGFKSEEFKEFILNNAHKVVSECNKILGTKKLKTVNSISYVVDASFDIVNIELNYA